MLITRIELENIKSYRHISIDFRRGTTAICGANGAGKTTLVEAIGYALFDSLAYKQDQFVREGEKHGRVVVHLIGSDDRPYTVERRCGSGSRWFVYDQESDYNVDQRADVLDKLHDLFGIDRERPLDSLFRDALGVPQGTFTSIFLETASKRKQTFDALLQIEDYKTSADYLLNSQRQYKEQMQVQKGEIGRLEYETRELEIWHAQLRDARLIDEQQKMQNVTWNELIARYRIRATLLTEQANLLERLRQRHETSQSTYDHEQSSLLNREQLLQSAQHAQQIVQASHTDYQLYQQATETLVQLRQQERKRNGLRQQQADFKNTQATIKAMLQNLQGRLQEVADARQYIVVLAPLVDQQIELEKQRDELMQKVTRYTSLLAESKKLSKNREQYLQRQAEIQRRITDIEPLVPLAEKLSERTELLTQLRIQSSERKSKQQQLQEKQSQLQEKTTEHEQSVEKLHRAENTVAVIEEHRSEAEQMPMLQGRYDHLAAQHHRLEGNIEGYAKSRAQSAGGQCPLLQESCLNIAQKGIASLESYFENLLSTERTLQANIRTQQKTLQEEMDQLKKYTEALSKLGQYVERRDRFADQLQRVAAEITRLERDITNLHTELDTLKLVEQQIAPADTAYKESKNADAKVRELGGLYKQIQQYQEQIHQCDAEISERSQEAERLLGSEAQLKETDMALAQLNDPRSRSKAQQAIVAQENQFIQRLQAEQHKELETEQRLQELQEQLATYTALDNDIFQQEASRSNSQVGYQNYLQHEKEAQTFPARESAYQRQLHTTEHAAQSRQEAERAYLQTLQDFDADELKNVQAEVERLNGELASLATKMQHQQEIINKLEQQIQQAEELLVLLEAARKEYATLEDLHAMMEQFRKLIKEAGPYVLKRMLEDISAQANRIFGEIMGDRAAELSWENDYEVTLSRRGVKRTFAQLSGGEQMSAALAIRLALLKKLSTLNVAFFDEPTQNMDEMRRMNLAEQIRRVRGFDQLIVISHDDTFEQGLDSIVRLKKDATETRLLEEDELREALIPDQGDAYATKQA